MRTRSLHQRFLRSMLAPLILIQLASTGVAYIIASKVATDAYDLSLLDNARDLSKQIALQHERLAINLPPVAQQMLQENNDDHVAYAAWDDTATLFFGTSKLLDLSAAALDRNTIFRDIVVDGDRYREIVVRGSYENKNYHIAVAQTMHGQDHLIDGIIASILIPEIILTVLSISVILFSVHRALAPVEELGAEISRRSPSEFSPIEEPSAPSDWRQSFMASTYFWGSCPIPLPRNAALSPMPRISCEHHSPH